ncbi:uncharacterized protein V2V93DRAFT_374084 [Kockiozyma suomiensis]|uniref:uncharacterized protein n=1 Tax=Kockiozyma suomiensis TaxID=1337062 RepID=UPI00334420C9
MEQPKDLLPINYEIFSYDVLWTAQMTQKRKTWNDGLVKFHTFNKRLMLYTSERLLIDSTYLKRVRIEIGETINMDKHIVTIESANTSFVQDVSSIIRQPTRTTNNTSKLRRETSTGSTPVKSSTLMSSSEINRQTFMSPGVKNMLQQSRYPLLRVCPPRANAKARTSTAIYQRDSIPDNPLQTATKEFDTSNRDLRPISVPLHKSAAAFSIPLSEPVKSISGTLHGNSIAISDRASSPLLPKSTNIHSERAPATPTPIARSHNNISPQFSTFRIPFAAHTPCTTTSISTSDSYGINSTASPNKQVTNTASPQSLEMQFSSDDVDSFSSTPTYSQLEVQEHSTPVHDVYEQAVAILQDETKNTKISFSQSPPKRRPLLSLGTRKSKKLRR